MGEKMKNRNILKLIIFVSFVIIISIPSLLMLAGYNSFSQEIEKREKMEKPRFTLREIKEYPDRYERYFNDSFGLRGQFIALNAIIKNKLFNTSSTSKAIVGKKGWYYYTLDNNIDIYRGTYPLNENLLEEIAEKQMELNEYFKSKNIEYVLVLTPSKVSIYPENLPDGGIKVHSETAMDILEEYLKKNTDIKVVNLKSRLLNSKNIGTLYFKTDTHWNYEGAYEGVSEIMDYLVAEKVILNKKNIEISKYDSTYKGEFSAMMGYEKLFPEEKIRKTKINNQTAVFDSNSDYYKEATRINIERGEARPVEYYRNSESPNLKTIAVFHDSFFGNFNAVPLIAENFENTVSIWSWAPSAKLIDHIKPNIVIVEITERYVDHLKNKLDYEISGALSSQLINLDSKILDITYNQKINRKYINNIKITVKNISNKNWTESRMIRLSIKENNIDKGMRLKLPENVKIKPNETYTFTLERIKIPKTGKVSLSFQMVEEGEKWFGEIKNLEINANR